MSASNIKCTKRVNIISINLLLWHIYNTIWSIFLKIFAVWAGVLELYAGSTYAVQRICHLSWPSFIFASNLKWRFSFVVAISPNLKKLQKSLEDLWTRISISRRSRFDHQRSFWTCIWINLRFYQFYRQSTTYNVLVLTRKPINLCIFIVILSEISFFQNTKKTEVFYSRPTHFKTPVSNLLMSSSFHEIIFLLK